MAGARGEAEALPDGHSASLGDGHSASLGRTSPVDAQLALPVLVQGGGAVLVEDSGDVSMDKTSFSECTAGAVRRPLLGPQAATALEGKRKPSLGATLLAWATLAR